MIGKLILAGTGMEKYQNIYINTEHKIKADKPLDKTDVDEVE